MNEGFGSQYEKNLFKNRYARAGWEKDWEDVFGRTIEYVTSDHTERHEYFEAMEQGLFIPGSPQLWNFGVEGETCGSSCFTGRIEDSLESIWEADTTARDVYKASGGIGFNLSTLRPRGASIAKSPNSAVGVLAVAKRLNDTTAYITAGGRARGALMLQLDVEHPDIVEFIFAKRPIRRNPGTEPAEYDEPLTQCNMSVRASDEFMRLKDDPKAQWVLRWENTHQTIAFSTWEALRRQYEAAAQIFGNTEFKYFYYKTLEPGLRHLAGDIKAQQIWNLIIENAWHHADPGIVFSDTYELMNPVPQLGKRLSNPCSEYVAPAGGSCDLASINLAYLVDPGALFNYRKLEKVTRMTTRYLNRVIDVNKVPIEYIHRTTKQMRNIGIGIMGLHDALILQSMEYDSVQALDFAAYVTGLITATGWEESFRLVSSQTCQAAPAWNKEAMEKIFTILAVRCDDEIAKLSVRNFDTHETVTKKWYALKERYKNLLKLTSEGWQAANTTITSVAPTGSISQIAGFIHGHQGVSGGIEPIYDWELMRQDHNGITKINHWTYALAKERNLSMRTANTIKPADHVLMQGAVARFVSMSVSKTINLASDCTLEEFSKAYHLAWKQGIPGTTCYRDQSKSAQVLSSTVVTPPTVTMTEVELTIKNRPTLLSGITEKISIIALGSLEKNIYMTINKNHGIPYEVFFHGFSREEDRSQELAISRELDTLSRLTSLALRYEVPVEEIIAQLYKIDGQHLYSLPRRLAKALSIDTKLGRVQFYCKECKKATEHTMADGCKTCSVCQTSAC